MRCRVSLLRTTWTSLQPRDAHATTMHGTDRGGVQQALHAMQFLTLVRAGEFAYVAEDAEVLSTGRLECRETLAGLFKAQIRAFEAVSMWPKKKLEAIFQFRMQIKIATFGIEA